MSHQRCAKACRAWDGRTVAGQALQMQALQGTLCQGLLADHLEQASMAQRIGAKRARAQAGRALQIGVGQASLAVCLHQLRPMPGFHSSFIPQQYKPNQVFLAQ